MINEEFTEPYFTHYHSFADILFTCWYNSLSTQNKELDTIKFRQQIRSFGYEFNYSETNNKKHFESPKNINFKTLDWLNHPTEELITDNVLDKSSLHHKALKEIERNLFKLSDRTNRIAYANLLIRELDKGNVKHLKPYQTDYSLKYIEFFSLVLDPLFMTEDNLTVNNSIEKTYPAFKLTNQLINHFYFIDKLIELFICFEIDLVELAEKSECNLFVFNNTSTHQISNNSQSTTIPPKFNSKLSDECLINIMHYLHKKKKLATTDLEVWLYWFNRKNISITQTLNWIGSPTLLSNVIQHLCGESISSTIKTAFSTNVFVKPTRKEYESGRTYKEIEQIITISNKKNTKMPD